MAHLLNIFVLIDLVDETWGSKIYSAFVESSVSFLGICQLYLMRTHLNPAPWCKHLTSNKAAASETHWKEGRVPARTNTPCVLWNDPLLLKTQLWTSSNKPASLAVTGNGDPKTSSKQAKARKCIPFLMPQFRKPAVSHTTPSHWQNAHSSFVQLHSNCLCYDSNLSRCSHRFFSVRHWSHSQVSHARSGGLQRATAEITAASQSAWHHSFVFVLHVSYWKDL